MPTWTPTPMPTLASCLAARPTTRPANPATARKPASRKSPTRPRTPAGTRPPIPRLYGVWIVPDSGPGYWEEVAPHDARTAGGIALFPTRAAANAHAEALIEALDGNPPFAVRVRTYGFVEPAAPRSRRGRGTRQGPSRPFDLPMGRRVG